MKILKLLSILSLIQAIIVSCVIAQNTEIDKSSLTEQHISHLNPKYSSLLIGLQKLSLSDYSLLEPLVKSDIIGLNNLNLKTHSLNYNISSLSPNLPVYPGLGDYRKFGGTLGSINVDSRLFLNYGAFICTQYSFQFSTKQIVLGANFLIRYQIANNFQFTAWGQYITEGKSNDPTFQMQGFFPKSNVGAGIQYNSSNNSKVSVGLEYQYDQKNKTWKPESGGKVSLNF